MTKRGGARRVLVASARLPVSLSRGGDGEAEWEARPSPGGLVTGLQPIAESRGLHWFGWPGTYVPPEQEKPVSALLAERDLHPVFASKADLDGFYLGFSNGVLWPLFHSLSGRAVFDDDSWDAYVRVNRIFAERIAASVGPDDIVWIHDYQLCLVPEHLRELGVHNVVGFFLHIPFPSAEMYRRLPVREEVLWGLLGADLLGFHSYEYVSHFRSAALRVLGLESGPGSIRTQSREVRLAVAPIGIDPAGVRRQIATSEARRELRQLHETYGARHLVVSADRLDYTKGIPEKLRAFEELLRRSPKFHDQVVLIQVAAPSRTGVDEYQQLKREVDELVGRINGRFGTSSWVPVVWVNQAVPRERLMGILRAADVALLTPLRDGMNLVALEYVAARRDDPGRLILSEFTGAAHWLPGARLVNPYSVTDVANALEEALESEPELESFGYMQEFVERNTSSYWGAQFLSQLESCERRQAAQHLDVTEPELRGRIERATRPLFLLDYDGTLRDFVADPQRAAPSQRLLRVLEQLTARATVYVVSGRDQATLERWLGHLPLGLACEHGHGLRHPGGKFSYESVNPAPMKRLVQPILEAFVARTPGSIIEQKKAGIAWHYRAVDPEYGMLRATELLPMLDERLKRRPYNVLRGNKVIEVRHENVSKGHVTRRILERHANADLVFAAGDDRTDEETMDAINESEKAAVSVTCWVRTRNTRASYWLERSTDLIGQLEAMVELLDRAPAPPERPTRKTKSARPATKHPGRS